MSALQLKIPPVAQFFIAAALMGVLAAVAPGRRFMVAGQLLPASVLLLLAGLVGMAGVRAFLRARTTANPLRPEQASTLVTGGIYRYSRNPMYLALFLALSAWGLWLGNTLSLLVLPTFVMAMNKLQIDPEERALEALFGAEFIAYRQRVRRWI